MVMKTICLAIALLFLYSCKKDNETIEAAPESTEAPATVTAVSKPAVTTPTLIAEFLAKKKEVQRKLSSLSAEEANDLYDSYKKENDSIMRQLEHNEQNILEHYYEYYSDDRGNPKAAPDSIAKKEALLKSAGIEFWEIGEGMVEIRTVANFYLSQFKGHVTEDYEDFIALLAKDDENLYSADAGIAISFNAVGKRMLSWEKFISKHPYSKLTPQAIDFYRMYQYGFLLGEDNTPTIEVTDNSIYPENLKEFAAFIAANPSSPTTALIKIVTETKGTKDEITKAVAKEQDKLIAKLTADTTPDYR
ncbi:hypothetical protein Q765_05000 [Flavobacterium rivuli WB 3.3-2 = DSM 21788]|uniref:Lipoprotein n=2 Tax=Flavobacterium rivuli TaxID=498301 RepID=A0A0A2MHQ3_9FLAO|nr:hypothetical protein Q765_05000 [Flavobacterium rivuli WB 3.3-2 = DSM 21788]